jgi:hypothetical protein
MANSNQNWFPAKRYGWGWGPPTTWQGWLLLALYIIGVSVVALVFMPHEHPVLFTILIWS